MAETTERTAEIIKKYQTHEKDTASPQVRIALITDRLSYLNEHFKSNKKDHHSRRGLMKMVGQRKQLLNYLRQKNRESYKDLISKLGIRG